MITLERLLQGEKVLQSMRRVEDGRQAALYRLFLLMKHQSMDDLVAVMGEDKVNKLADLLTAVNLQNGLIAKHVEAYHALQSGETLSELGNVLTGLTSPMASGAGALHGTNDATT